MDIAAQDELCRACCLTMLARTPFSRISRVRSPRNIPAGTRAFLLEHVYWWAHLACVSALAHAIEGRFQEMTAMRGL